MFRTRSRPGRTDHDGSSTRPTKYLPMEVDQYGPSHREYPKAVHSPWDPLTTLVPTTVTSVDPDRHATGPGGTFWVLAQVESEVEPDVSTREVPPL